MMDALQRRELDAQFDPDDHRAEKAMHVAMARRGLEPMARRGLEPEIAICAQVSMTQAGHPGLSPRISVSITATARSGALAASLEQASTAKANHIARNYGMVEYLTNKTLEINEWGVRLYTTFQFHYSR